MNLRTRLSRSNGYPPLPIGIGCKPLVKRVE
jgi:hypothetical protein